MTIWADPAENTVVSACNAAAEEGRDTDAWDFLISTRSGAIGRAPGYRYLLALKPAAAEAVRETLALVPEVICVLWATIGGHVRIVTLVAETTDDVMLRVADQELALMDRLAEFSFEFRIAPQERFDTFVAAGYTPVLQVMTNADAEAA